ncbi:hypothetical protein GGF43_006862, partial [Coemansia sp. RSA 2618]
MAAPRQLVSYDDLFDSDEDTADTAQQQQQQAESESEDDGVGSIMARTDAWDDTELIRAWDGTIADYRKFHAGVLGDETQRSAERQLECKVGQWTAVSTSPSRKRKRELPNAGSEAAYTDSKDAYTDSKDANAEGAQHAGQEIAEWAAQSAPPQSEEDAMHRLNMAWYYVGYYTACYQ